MVPPSTGDLPATLALVSLRRRWLVATLVGAALAVAGFASLSQWWEPVYARRWGLQTALVFVYQTLFLWRALKHNHRPGELSLLSTLGMGNTLTIVRGWLLAFLAGFLFTPWPTGWMAWIPGTLYLLVGLADYLDGVLARLADHSTLLGEQLDLELDALGILIASLLGVWYGQLPIWYLTVSAARYLFIAGVWVLKRRGRPVYNLTSSHIRRALAGFQMGLNAAVLWPIFSPPGTWIIATLFMIPFLAGFTRDWLVVSGGVDPTSARYARTLRRTVEATTGWLPLGLRIVVAVVAGWLGIGHLSTALRAETPWQLGAGAIVLATAVLISLGILGRLASLTMLVTIGLTMTGSRLDVTTIVMMIGASLLLLLGTGRFSIWKPEDDFLSRRYGEKQGKGGDVEHG